MTTGSKKKRRIDRVTSLELPPGVWGTLWDNLRRGHVLVRLALCAHRRRCCCGSSRAAGRRRCRITGAMCRRATSWPAPSSSDPTTRPRARPATQARSLAIAIYDQDPTQLEQLRAKIENDVTQLLAAESLRRRPDDLGTVPPAARRRHAAADGRRASRAVSKVSRVAFRRRRTRHVQDRAGRVACSAEAKGLVAKAAAGARRQRGNDHGPPRRAKIGSSKTCRSATCWSKTRPQRCRSRCNKMLAGRRRSRFCRAAVASCRKL